MAYDEGLAAIIEDLTIGRDGFTTKRMFGGLCYLQHGNMACGIHEDRLMVRLGDDESARAAIDAGQALPMDFTGKVMKGWVLVPAEQITGPEVVKSWIDQGLAFAGSLPPK